MHRSDFSVPTLDPFEAPALRELLDNLQLIAVLIDPSGLVLYANPRFLEVTGYRAEEVLHRDYVEMFLPAAAREHVRAIFLPAIAQDTFPRHFSNPIATRSGEQRMLRWSNTALRSPQSKVLAMISIGEDVTESLAAEQALKASEEHYRTLVHHSADVISVIDERGIRHYISPTVQQLQGFTPEQLLGIDAFELVHPEDLPRAKQAFAEVLRAPGAVARVELRTRHALGHWIDVEVVGCNQLTNPVVCGILLNIRDISARKQAEQQRLQLEQQLLQARKMESVGVLAGGIAHDFNNLLTTMLGYASLARMQLQQTNAQLTEYLASIEQAALRAAELCQQLLAYAGKSLLAFTNVQLSEIARTVAADFRRELPPSVQLHLQLLDPCPILQADAYQVRQAMLYLLRNALEALEGKQGTITLSTGEILLDRQMLGSMVLDDALAEGPYLFVEIADTGCGMDQSMLTTIFDPFFSTKFPGRGLGLPAVLGIARSHKGAVQVQSELGKGTRFRVFFPRLTNSP